VEQVAQAVDAARKLGRGQWTTKERVRFSHRPYFADALLAYEAWISATDSDPSELREWRRVARAAVGAGKESANRGTRPPGRRRRRTRKRRGKAS
jgi:hypothetical protein